MLKKFTALFLLAIGAVAQLSAQVTTVPTPVQENTQNLTIYFHADQGNKGLANLPASTQIYAHTGVLTGKSNSDSDWKYAPTWGDNSEKYLLTYVEPNLYSLYIGDIRTYYGITDPTETIRKLAFVFRTADKSKEGKTSTGGDIFVDVLEGGFQLALTTNLNGSNIITADNSTVQFNLGATEAANLSLLIDGNQIASKDNATLLEATYTFPAPGDYNVVGRAVRSNGETETTEMTITYPESSKQMNYPGGVPRMGAVANNDGSVTFCIAAPGKNSVMLVDQRNGFMSTNDNVMYYQDYNGFRYFWITVPDIDPTEMFMYYYLVDGTKAVGDPYAKLILDPSNDKYIPESVYPNLPAYPSNISAANLPIAIYQGNLNDYNWTDDNFVTPAKDNLIIYELLFRDFTGTEGQAYGNGTVKMALEKLPYLKTLGVNCIELLPINEFNGNISWGYNPNFYFAPDKAYGTPDDYKEFINACHENGIAVVLDMVFNQTDWLHPWYQMYNVGSNPFYNASAPHAYSVLNDWNQGYGLVREQWKDVVQYWISEYHVDGYRFDLVKGLGDNDSYPNNGDSGTNQYNASRVKNMRQIQEWILEVKPDALFINENLAGTQEENEMAAYGQLNWANINTQGGQYAMGYNSNASLNRMYAPYDSRTWGSTVSYLESHDEQRLAYQQNQYGDANVKGNLANSMKRLGSAACQMIMAPGSHMIWMFSELGNDQNTKDNTGGNNTDPKKVLWSYYDVPDRHGLYENYCELISIRRNNPELFAQDATMSLDFMTWDGGRYFHSTKDGKEIHALINPKTSGTINMKATFGSDSQSDYYIISKSYGTNPTFEVGRGQVTIPANSYVVIANNAVVDAVDEIIADFEGVEIVGEDYYDLTGVRVENPENGIYVKVVRYANGTTRSFKEIVK